MIVVSSAWLRNLPCVPSGCPTDLLRLFDSQLLQVYQALVINCVDCFPPDVQKCGRPCMRQQRITEGCRLHCMIWKPKWNWMYNECKYVCVLVGNCHQYIWWLMQDLNCVDVYAAYIYMLYTFFRCCRVQTRLCHWDCNWKGGQRCRLLCKTAKEFLWVSNCYSPKEVCKKRINWSVLEVF